MHRRWSAIVAFGIACLALPARGLIIDDFRVAQMVSGPLSYGPPVTTSVSGDMLGGRRTMTVGGVPSSAFPALAASAVVDSGTLSFTQSEPLQRFVSLYWFSPIPLDLTEGGTTSAFETHVDSFSGVTTVLLAVTVGYGGNQQDSRVMHTLSDTGTLRFDLSAFPNVANFDNVSTISMSVQTYGEAVLSGGLVLVPEPGSAALLLAGLACVAARRKQRP